MKYFPLILFLLVASVCDAGGSKTTPEQYIALYKKAAIEEMKKSGVPASITLSQGMLESAYGNSKLARKARNHFGIKCHSDWKGPSVRKDDDAKNECFRKYKNVSESFHDHSKFLRGKPRYAFLFDYKTTDYKAWAKGLKKAGYATNPKYPKLLIDLIERYDLSQYDNKGGGKGKSKKSKSKSKSKSKNKVKSSSEIDEGEVHVKSRVRVSDNFVKYIVVKKGDNIRSIAKETGVGKRRLMKYNERTGNKVSRGEKIYLQPKKKSSRTKYHQVKRGETLYQISQRYAVTTKSIMKRNRMGTNSVINPGQKLKLRGRKIKL